MRWWFWPDRSLAETLAAPAAASAADSGANRSSRHAIAALDDLDLRAIGETLWARRKFIVAPTLAVAMVAFVIVNLVTPRYKSEARVLVDGRENIFLRPNAERADERVQLDQEAITSQVQLILSRDLALNVIRKTKLADLPEFDPARRGLSPLKAVLALIGIGRDPLNLTPEERVLDAYYDRLTAYAVDKSRVIAIEFQSRDPKLAARVANAIADGYLVMQQAAKQQQAKSAGQWLAGEIDNLRKKVSEAEQRVEDFRSKSNLFIGTNNTLLSSQQLSEINSQLSAARAQKADAEARSAFIRRMLDSGRPVEASEVLNSELVRRLGEQRVTLLAQLAEQSSTLMDNHPRIKELRAQIANLDAQLREEARKIVRALENDARIAGSRVEQMTKSLDALKHQATSTNGNDVKLRALEREARAQRELLESYLAKYREATTRETIDAAPADARIISRAIISNNPAYPKKFPIVLISALATFILMSGWFTAVELMAMTGGGPDGRFIRNAPDTDPELGRRLSEIEAFAQGLRGGGSSARRLVCFGLGATNPAMTALTLARLLSRDAHVVLIDLVGVSAALAATATNSAGPGLTDLVAGRTSFGEIVTRDRLSRLHLVLSGSAAPDASTLASPRLSITVDALTQVYDHVVMVGGGIGEERANFAAAQSRALIIAGVPVAGHTLDAADVEAARAQLRMQGFTDVDVLGAVAADVGQGDTALRVAAA